MSLEEFFKENSRVALAFSGGVDSAYLLYAAKLYGADVKAYYVKSSFQPRFEYDDACKLAKHLNANMQTINVDVLSCNDVKRNPKNRCYYCKQVIFKTILEAARKDGYGVLLDGTNASDEYDDRPGMKALQELKVLSPLRLCNLTKDEIRRLSKDVGLFTYNKPAYACLATRIKSEEEITEEKLKRVEECEDYLFSLGFTDFRVRTVEDMAKLQIKEDQLELFVKNRELILNKLNKYFKESVLDLKVR